MQDFTDAQAARGYGIGIVLPVGIGIAQQRQPALQDAYRVPLWSDAGPEYPGWESLLDQRMMSESDGERCLADSRQSAHARDGLRLTYSQTCGKFSRAPDKCRETWRR